jgi:CRP/FNR family transcriptional regulator
MYASLLAHIKRFVSLAPEEEEILLKYLQQKQIKNKELVLKSGQVCDAYYFVAQGVLRMYTITDSGNEHIIQFGIDNWWLCDYTSFDTKKPSQFNIQALEPSTLIIIDRKVQEELFEKIPKLERYFRLILQRAYSATLIRVHYIFTTSGEARYHHFNNLFPEFVQRIPQYMLASYLGFTPEFLSKIRAKKV